MSTEYQSNHAEQRSLPELIRELRDESTALLREEVALAKTEMSEKASHVSRNATTLAAGGMLAHVGLIFLLLAATYGLHQLFIALELPVYGEWLAPLIVGLIVGFLGLAMMLKAKDSLSHTSLVPEKTVQTLRDDKNWAQEKAR